VARHETLYSLSVHFYGTGSRWREILAANRDKLSGEHPSLEVGEVLRIP
jgi:nucleoid-associated protein YgaU